MEPGISLSRGKESEDLGDGSPVYIDVLFAVNLVMDFIIIWTTARLVGIKVFYQRIFMASVLGAVYSIGSIFPELASWYDFPIKVLFSGILVILAFWPKSWRQFVKLWACFYGVSFVTAGAVIGSSYLFQGLPNGAYPDFSYLWLGGGVACALALGTYGDQMLRQKVVPHLMRCPVQVRFGTAWCQGEGFIDTGNRLVDPLTNRPVIIAEYHLVSGCFPGDVRQALEGSSQQVDLFEVLAQTSWANRLRLIPFTSIGKKHGMMVGVRSDEFAVNTGTRWQSFSGVVVGLYLDRLSPEDSFQVLLPASFVNHE